MDWENAYQEGNTGWDRKQINPALLHWLDSNVLHPCRILIPGCGFGYEVCELARRGFDVTAIDLAPTAVTRLKKTLQQQKLTATVIEEDLFDQSLPFFDVIYEQTCLCATEPKCWQHYEQWLRKHLRSDGRLFALFMQTVKDEGPPFHCGIDAMHELFHASHWQWPDANDHYISPHYHGKFEHGMVLVKR